MIEQQPTGSDVQPQQNHKADRSWMIALTSFCFIVLQSACSAFMAISGLRLLLGVGSLAAASSGLKILDALHGSAIRIPMTILAILGSFINLYAVWRVRSLRARPASQWRMAPVPASKKRSESIQIAIAVVTLVLVAIESAAHIHSFGSIFR